VAILFAPLCAAETPATHVQLTREDVSSWLDGYIGPALVQYDMAGAAVAVVAHGELLIAKAYGFDDLSQRRPVDAERTLFRAESVSKVFTATAVMQLVERGQIDLDRDVNDYLDFVIAPMFGKPITLRNLLTHTAGFVEAVKGSSFIDPAHFPSLGDYLKVHLPARVFPPGEVAAYSNYGNALAGYIVERVSGQPYAKFVADHIFAPLGMHQTSCDQPLPAAAAANVAKAYSTIDSPVQPFELIAAAPAGCVTATVTDMAKFMIAHLQEGRFPGGFLLQPDSARLMHAPQFTAAPGALSMGLSFMQQDRNGRHIIGHSGDGLGSHSDLHLFLDDGVGLYIAFNSDGTNSAVHRLRKDLFDAFADRYFPSSDSEPATATTAAEHSQAAEGYYHSARRLSGILSMVSMFNETRVSANADGTISTANSASGRVVHWREVAPWRWREVGGQDLMVMKPQAARAVALYENPAEADLRVAIWQTRNFNLILVGGALAVLFASLLALPIAAAVRRHYGLPPLPRNARRWPQRLTYAAAGIDCVFILGWIVGLGVISSQIYAFNAQLDPWIRAWQLLGLLGVMGTVFSAWNCVLAWRERNDGWTRAGCTLTALACFAISWFSFVFNLLTLNLEY
jgi:CubicO group peptidase (beta-lactamase class C family)